MEVGRGCNRDGERWEGMYRRRKKHMGEKLRQQQGEVKVSMAYFHANWIKSCQGVREVCLWVCGRGLF